MIYISIYTNWLSYYKKRFLQWYCYFFTLLKTRGITPNLKFTVKLFLTFLCFFNRNFFFTLLKTRGITTKLKFARQKCFTFFMFFFKTKIKVFFLEGRQICCIRQSFRSSLDWLPEGPSVSWPTLCPVSRYCSRSVKLFRSSCCCCLPCTIVAIGHGLVKKFWPFGTRLR